MSGYSMGMRAVYAAQEDSVYLDRSVWTAWFYVHLLDVLEHETWREYSTEAYGRQCRFESLSQFLSHEDGLRWRSVDETLGMMELVRDCPKKLEPERDAPADETLQQYAKKTLEALAKRGVTRTDRAQAVAEAAKGLVGTFAQAGNPHGNRDNITVRSAGDGGTSAAYLAARLKKAGRDDLLDQIGPEKPYRSIRAAAIEAGIVKPVPTVRLVDDPAKVAAAICSRTDQSKALAIARAIIATTGKESTSTTPQP